MKKTRYLLKAGVSQPWFGEGRYFRILSAKFPVTISTDSGIESEIITGIGCNLSNPQNNKPFYQLNMVSKEDQEVTVLVSSFPTTDSRLSGDVDVNGLLSVVNSGGSRRVSREVSVTKNQAVKLLDKNSDRLKAVIGFDVAGRIGDSSVSASSGFTVAKGGHWTDQNTDELWFFAFDAGSVSTIEDYK